MEKFFERIVDIWDTHTTGVAIFMIITSVLLGIAIAFGITCIKVWAVMLLWNWIAVGLLNAPALSFWTAFGLCALCSLLFKTKITLNKEED